ncbi:HD domain-containing protein [Candidatus Uhrbacteria bacterium]|nr:HD domain-containing protein [Candidatus Uhrbacteria bacterium]
MADFELRDPIHHRIVFSGFERSIIDHPFFQRLRFISQLGFIQAYVYPGAVHDRFMHGIGAMHIAGRLFGRVVAGAGLSLSPQELEALRQRVRIAGLLHDIGHGPFSHASESVFPDLDHLPLEWNWWNAHSPRKAVHEDYSVLLIQTLAKEEVLDADFAQDVCSLIHQEVKASDYLETLVKRIPGLKRVLKGLISGEVDCDRMDYLLRDSYFCGVAYGQYDLDWLISAMSAAPGPDGLVVALSENGVRAYEDLLLARYHMIDQVYYHKTKAGFEHYLREAITTHEIPLSIPTDPYAYVQLRDGAVIEQMFEAAKNSNHYWSRHMVERIPARRVLRLHQTKPEELKLLDQLKYFCTQQNIRFFTHTVSNELTHFGQGETDRAGMLYVARKLVNGVEHVPVFKYSDLLQKYSEKLQFTDFFVLREDADRFDLVKKNVAW